MDKQKKKILEFFTVKKIAIPIFIGIAATTFLFLKGFSFESLEDLQWSGESFFFLLMSFFMVMLREAALMVRLRILTLGQLSWKKCFQVIILWSFASAATPTIIGGGAIALFIMSKEGIKLGRATAIVLVCTVLDELFYFCMVPVVIGLAGTENLLVSSQEYFLFNSKVGNLSMFLIANSLILLYTSLIIYGIFINPRGTKKGLVKVFKNRFLKRWQDKAEEAGSDIIVTSREYRKKPFAFWAKAFGATGIMWFARFGVVNMLVLAFVGFGDQMLIFARQIVIWALLLISPTPGGSGVAEYAFAGFLGEFAPNQGLAPAMGVIWRLISYYPFLIIGLFVLPAWLKRVYQRKEKSV